MSFGITAAGWLGLAGVAAIAGAFGAASSKNASENAAASTQNNIKDNVMPAYTAGYNSNNTAIANAQAASNSLYKDAFGNAQTNYDNAVLTQGTNFNLSLIHI